MKSTSRSFTWSAIPRAMRAACQWRLLLLWTGAMLAPTAIVTVPAWQMLRANLDHSVHVGALSQRLDMTALADLLSAYGRSSAAFTGFGITALIVTLLISPLLSGMALTAVRSPQAPGFGALTRGGVDAYPRMLRMLAWAALPLGLALLLGECAIGGATRYGATATVAADAELATWAAAALAALLFAIAHASVDAGRAVFAVAPERSSAIKAWWSGCLLLARRPFAAIGVYLVISVCGLGLAALLGVSRLNLAGVSFGGFAGALVLTQVIVAVIGWMRVARLFALTELAAAQSAAPR